MKIEFMGREHEVKVVAPRPPYRVVCEEHLVVVSDERGVLVWWRDGLPPGLALAVAQRIANTLDRGGPQRERLLRRWGQ